MADRGEGSDACDMAYRKRIFRRRRRVLDGLYWVAVFTFSSGTVVLWVVG